MRQRLAWRTNATTIVVKDAVGDDEGDDAVGDDEGDDTVGDECALAVRRAFLGASET